MNKRTVVVTGGASGIGRATAEAFVAAGDRVFVADIAGRGAADEIGADGAEYVEVDISDPASVDAAVDAVIGRAGPINVLVNNAGIVGGGGPLTVLDVNVFDRCVQVNFRGTFLMTRAVGAHMVAAGTRGAIVNISSIGARQPTPGLGHYEATKAAVDALTRSAALELAPHGIRVNGVAPGPVLTPMTAGFASDTAARQAWEARIPLGSIASVADVVPSVVFLASADARHITGAILQVDGGQLLV
ncbi:SDR family NAD(P)-dependent oxidoreductase [Actinocrispum wychmicini]|uniref:NAD(P)-dependent dehydrogenase (Short-subunit alcohol dehydrogenase family) n=1 Tax=Actinocrispum wychmicini TaxID=1213861 RepID=A0A4R2JSK9_9PSEU|nr:SDR family NAD(P)-dependent oxidoreductase [Actinocrispum wychmicini]TCO59869.1 NAD(P)-dependent dehydrogenase (short-subunit alcohol dehydrogenase family) [Actinocrispum wychmicini]